MKMGREFGSQNIHGFFDTLKRRASKASAISIPVAKPLQDRATSRYLLKLKNLNGQLSKAKSRRCKSKRCKRSKRNLIVKIEGQIHALKRAFMKPAALVADNQKIQSKINSLVGRKCKSRKCESSRRGDIAALRQYMTANQKITSDATAKKWSKKRKKDDAKIATIKKVAAVAAVATAAYYGAPYVKQGLIAAKKKKMVRSKTMSRGKKSATDLVDKQTGLPRNVTNDITSGKMIDAGTSWAQDMAMQQGVDLTSLGGSALLKKYMTFEQNRLQDKINKAQNQSKPPPDLAITGAYPNQPTPTPKGQMDLTKVAMVALPAALLLLAS